MDPSFSRCTNGHLNPPEAVRCLRCGQELGAASAGTTAGEVAIGQVLAGRYELREELGRGGMGVVYRAVDRSLEREVALKVLRADLVTEPKARERMAAEARALAKVSHPNIVTIFDVCESGGLLVLVLEFAKGGTLASRLVEGGPTAVEEAVRLMQGVLSGLQALHDHGLVHRDVKPSNVLLTENGTPKVGDLGVAHHGAGERRTKTGALLGTPEYMAPEQVRARPVDARTDVYAAGLLLYELLVGEPPFVGDSEYDVMEAQVNQPPDLDRLPAGTPMWVQSAIAGALKKAPEARWSDASSMAAALARHGAPTSQARVGVALPLRTPKGRKLTLRSAMALVGILTGGALVVVAGRAARTMSAGAAQSSASASGIASPGAVPSVDAGARRGPAMVQIPAGSFRMGSSDGYGDEQPAHTEAVAAFEMDATEVTVDQYRACVKAGACGLPTPHTETCNWGVPAKGDHPMNCITLNEAQAFCTWAGKRLPTETEWEHAAAGTEGRMYPWGSDAPGDQLCWKRNHSFGTCPAGSHPAGNTPLGVLDLAGNVSEWTSSRYCSSYEPDALCDLGRVVNRGGSWLDTVPTFVRSANRHGNTPTDRASTLGFRCVRSDRSGTPGLSSAVQRAPAMVRIPAGRFSMGSNDGEADEKPVHEETVGEFEMDVTEVTVGSYRACVSAGGCPSPKSCEFDLDCLPSSYSICNWQLQGRDDHPMNCIGWNDATTYCAWAGKRLPTETEWEYAARGADARIYPWGNSEPPGKVCWDKTQTQGTCAVGSYPGGVSPFGLMDMAGNVSEWTSSLYCDSYAPGAKCSSDRVYRGGGFAPGNERSANRAWGGSPSLRRDYLGFRCARSPVP